MSDFEEQEREDEREDENVGDEPQDDLAFFKDVEPFWDLDDTGEDREGLPHLQDLLAKDLRAAAATLGQREVRYLVATYYQLQETRKRQNNQIRALQKYEEPRWVTTWAAGAMESLEKMIGKVLDYYTRDEATGMGKWARDISGIGPVIAAGLLAHVDITQCPTAGHLWAFAGLDPTAVWLPKTIRPWNAALKTLCWKIGESFTKVSGRPTDIYGKVYLSRKQYEWPKNMHGEYTPQGDEILRTKNIGHDTVAYGWYAGKYVVPKGTSYTGASDFPFKYPEVVPADGREGAGPLTVPGQMSVHPNLPLADSPEGIAALANGGQIVRMLPPGHIHSRAKRYAVKLFLAHFWEEWYVRHHQTEPPLPYPIVELGHAHKIERPNPTILVKQAQSA